MEKTKIMVCMKKKKFHLIFLFFLSSNPVIREFGRNKKTSICLMFNDENF